MLRDFQSCHICRFDKGFNIYSLWHGAAYVFATCNPSKNSWLDSIQIEFLAVFDDLVAHTGPIYWGFTSSKLKKQLGQKGQYVSAFYFWLSSINIWRYRPEVLYQPRTSNRTIQAGPGRAEAEAELVWRYSVQSSIANLIFRAVCPFGRFNGYINQDLDTHAPVCHI